MGKASINSCDQGQASILYQREQAYIIQVLAQMDTDLAAMDADIAIREAQILDMEAQLADYVAQIDAQVSAFGTCLTTYGPEPSAEAKKAKPPPPPWPCAGMADVIQTNQKNCAKSSAMLYDARHAVAQIKAQKKALDALYLYYEAERDLHDLMDVWVADWTEDTENPPAASVTGTVEVWGMYSESGTENVAVPRSKVILCPQYTPAERPYQASRDFMVEGPMNSEASMVFSHLATWCWVQEHRPRYITARINVLNRTARTASVTRTTPVGLDPIPGVTEWGAIDVPFHYRDCQDRAFRVGDRVIVEFSGPNKVSPRIIGFEDHPRPCDVDPPIVLWDATDQKYIRLEYLQDLGAGHPGWMRTDWGNVPLAGSFQWRRMSDGALISVVSTTITGSFSGGAIFKDEALLDSGPSGKTCTGAALLTAGHLVAFCIDSGANQVSLWVKASGGSWAELFARNGVHVVNYQGALFNQACTECYAAWTQDDQPTIGAWKISLTWGPSSVSVSSVDALADSNWTATTTDSGTWDDGYDGADGYKTQNLTFKNSFPRAMAAYSPEDGSVRFVGFESEETSIGSTTGTWTDPPPGSYRFEQEGSAKTFGQSRLTGAAAPNASLAYGGDTASEVVFSNAGTPTDILTTDGFSAPAGQLHSAIASLGLSAPFPNYNSRIISPLHFGGLLAVGDYQIENGAAGPALPLYAALLRADGSLLAAYSASNELLYPAPPPRLTMTPTVEEWNTQDTSVTARIPYAQEVFHNVAETPSGRAIGISGNHTSGVFVIDEGDVATLVPEWAAGHTIQLIGFSLGWKGKGIPWP